MPFEVVVVEMNGAGRRMLARSTVSQTAGKSLFFKRSCCRRPYTWFWAHIIWHMSVAIGPPKRPFRLYVHSANIFIMPTGLIKADVPLQFADLLLQFITVEVCFSKASKALTSLAIIKWQIYNWFVLKNSFKWNRTVSKTPGFLRWF